MGKRIDVEIGDRYGRLTIVRESPKQKGKRYFICKCDCGNEINTRFIKLRAGGTKSCGCFRIEQNKTMNITHKETKTRLYRIWHCMKQRCLNPNLKSSKWYVEKGITICPEWLDYIPFKTWAINNGYSESLTIDRIDSKGNYEPSNCRWATMKEQLRNTSRTKNISFKGKTLCVTDWANSLKISNSGMQKRLKNWTLEKALTTCNSKS